MKTGERIRYLRKQLDMTQTELGEKLGVKTNAVSKWECGRVEDIPTSKLKAMAALFDVPLSYLIDDVLGEPKSGNVFTPIPPGFRGMPEMTTVPIIGHIACGEPILAEENVEGETSVPEKWRASFCLVCEGDSMEPRIKDGDLVAIRQQEIVENGEIAAVRIGDEATLKHVYLYPNYIELRPENPAYASIIRAREEMNDVHIEGRAVGLCRGI